jgi:hypothetical protein
VRFENKIIIFSMKNAMAYYYAGGKVNSSGIGSWCKLSYNGTKNLSRKTILSSVTSIPQPGTRCTILIMHTCVCSGGGMGISPDLAGTANSADGRDIKFQFRNQIVNLKVLSSQTGA